MSSPLQLSFDLYNVFCYPDAEGKSRPFTGNPLAIIYVPEGVAASDSQLLTLARQFNLSETTFPSQAQGTNYSVKIYTIESELPFAGHPTVGTCMSMLDRGLISRPGVGQSITQQTLSGPIKLLTPTNDTVFFSSPLKFISPSPLATPPTLISSLCLPAATPITPTLRVSSCGLPFLYVQLEREEDLKLAKPNPTAIKSLIAGWKEDGATPCGIYLFWAGPLKEKSEGEVSVEIKGRMLFTDPGEGEPLLDWTKREMVGSLPPPLRRPCHGFGHHRVSPASSPFFSSCF